MRVCVTVDSDTQYVTILTHCICASYSAWYDNNRWFDRIVFQFVCDCIWSCWQCTVSVTLVLHSVFFTWGFIVGDIMLFVSSKLTTVWMLLSVKCDSHTLWNLIDSSVQRLSKYDIGFFIITQILTDSNNFASF